MHSFVSAEVYGFDSASLEQFVNWGFQGVDVFFVISGFVMIYVQFGKKSTPIDFVANRAIRIIPLYWALTTFTIIAAILLPSFFRKGPPDLYYYVSSMGFFSYLMHDRQPMLYVGWTLEYELVFYALLAVSLSISMNLRKAVAVSGALLIALVISGLLKPIAVEFFLGELLALYYLSGRSLRFPSLILAIGICGLLFPLLYGRSWSGYFEDNRAIFFAIPALMVVASALYLSQTHNRLLIFLGNASYSIYLIQALTISTVCKAFAKVAPGLPIMIPAATSVIVTCIAGAVSYRMFEVPVTRMLAHFWASHSPRNNKFHSVATDS